MFPGKEKEAAFPFKVFLKYVIQHQQGFSVFFAIFSKISQSNAKVVYKVFVTVFQIN